MPEPLTPEREAEIRGGDRSQMSRGDLSLTVDDLLAEIDRLRARIAELETFADGMTDLQNERVDEIDRLREEIRIRDEGILALLDVAEAAEFAGRARPDSIAGVPVDELYEGMGK